MKGVRLHWKILFATVLPLLALTSAVLWTVNQSITEQAERNVREDLIRAASIFEDMMGARAEEPQLEKSRAHAREEGRLRGERALDREELSLARRRPADRAGDGDVLRGRAAEGEDLRLAWTAARVARGRASRGERRGERVAVGARLEGGSGDGPVRDERDLAPRQGAEALRQVLADARPQEKEAHPARPREHGDLGDLEVPAAVHEDA